MSKTLQAVLAVTAPFAFLVTVFHAVLVPYLRSFARMTAVTAHGANFSLSSAWHFATTTYLGKGLLSGAFVVVLMAIPAVASAVLKEEV